ncbi:hypothetical protein HYU92_00180 [Candidatus Curtissbacteria bacterium]|nr:hypothetical protein [Candidatus Curtissbacteria bacterium]
MIALVFNLPFTLIGIISAIFSLPYQIRIVKNPLSLVIKVRKFWWVFGYMKNARAMTIGYIVLLGPRLLRNDLEHEFIHVKQFQKYPLIFPLLYFYELLKNGPRKNRFEDEAYTLSRSIYEGSK